MTDSDDEVVLEVGFEGGALTLYRRASPGGGEVFYTSLNQVALYAMVEDDPLPGEPVSCSAPCTTFEEGLALLDESTFWVRLYVMQVAPAFAERVLAAVEGRLARLDLDAVLNQRVLGRWRRSCERAAEE